MKIFHHKQPFRLESGAALQALDIGYHTYGTLNDEADNVIWICHALTANSNPEEWWPGMVGKDLIFDTDKYFIVCANILGSCYGTTGPLSNNPRTGDIYGHYFPDISIRDMVAVHDLLRTHLGIRKIFLLVGGSMGGYQALEWAVMAPELINKLFLIATAARETSWGIGIHTAQRMSIEADQSWSSGERTAGREGLKAARAFGMIVYRSYENYLNSQVDVTSEPSADYKASSYVRYQGEKLAKRFNAFSYYLLTLAMDSHDLQRVRDQKLAEILQNIGQDTLIIGITSDLLCPIEEQRFLAEYIPENEFEEMKSAYGHDGFLVETNKISAIVKNWLLKSLR